MKESLKKCERDIRLGIVIFENVVVVAAVAGAITFDLNVGSAIVLSAGLLGVFACRIFKIEQAPASEVDPEQEKRLKDIEQKLGLLALKANIKL